MKMDSKGILKDAIVKKASASKSIVNASKQEYHVINIVNVLDVRIMRDLMKGGVFLSTMLRLHINKCNNIS